MPLHYFHCTDGIDLVLDRKGRSTRSRRDRHFKACTVAEEIMRTAPSEIDWSKWVVSVHDGRGALVEIVSFPVVEQREAA